MSNIRTFKDLESGPNKSALPNPWNSQTRARSASNEPLYTQEYSQQQQGGMQYIGVDGYPHTLPPNQMNPCNICCVQCCPCLVSPCSSERKIEWVNMMKSFMFVVSVLQIIMFIVELAVGGFAPTSVNPMLGPPTITMIKLGAKVPSLERYQGQVYRFFVPIFLHAGFIHILFNIFAQLRFALYLERQWGVRDTMIIYFLSGIGGALFSSLVQPSSVSVGASGAILGMMGGDLAALLFNSARMSTQQRTQSIVQAVFFIVIILIFGAAPNIDWSAHLGGLITGFCTGAAIFGRKSESDRVRQIVPLSGLASVIIFFVLGFALFYTVVHVPRIEYVY